MVTDDAIRQEMAYTTYAQSCHDPHIAPDGSLRECRRPLNHELPHASDGPLIKWGAGS